MSPPVAQRTFAGGELNPAAFGRVDLSLYEKSARILRNMLCLKHGGVTGRPGTQYIGTALNGGNQVRLMPFIFNETGLGQSYMLEFGNQYIAFYQNGANVISTFFAITAATQFSVITVTAPSHTFVNGDIVTISGVVGMTQLNNGYYIVGGVATNVFDLSDLFGNFINSSAFGAYISGGTVSKIYKIASPYLQADLQSLKFAESADVITITHQNYAIRELRRMSALNWTLTQITNFGSNVPWPTGVVFSGTPGPNPSAVYYISSVDAQGQESDSASPNFSSYQPGFFSNPSPAVPVHITWNSSAGAITYRIYASRSGPGNTGGFIGETPATSFDDIGQLPDFTNQFPLYTQLFGNDGSGNCPATVGFSQQRRYFANTIANPIGFWGSRPGNFSNFDIHVTSQDDDAVISSIAGEEVNAIQHITELKFMLMLTAGAELYVQGNGSGVVTPSAINASVQSQYGCSTLRPLKTGDVLIFNQALGSFVRDFVFDFAIDGYRGNDITIFASHLVEGFQISDWAYQKVPDSMIWAVRSDGQLLCCTYIREQQVLAWTHHDFGLNTNTGALQGFVENICAIPENGEYAVYLSIRRVIGSHIVRYIERLSSRIWQGPAVAVANGTANPIGDPIDATYLDCYSSYDGRNTGATTMMLRGGITIVTGVNDGVEFNDGVEHSITIPPGAYDAETLFGLVGTLMSAASGHSYTGTPIAGIFQMSGNVATYTFKFNVGDPNYANSAGPTLGFPPGDYSSGGSFVVHAPNYPIGSFSSGPNAYQQRMSLISSVGYFQSPVSIGDQIFIQDALWISSQGQQGLQVKCTIQDFGNPQTAVVTPDTAVPVEFQNTSTVLWSRAVKTVSGLTYLQGQSVSVWADRFLVGSPLNSHVDTIYTVSGGQITLDKCYAVIYVGLPMTQDIETLDLETYFGPTILGRCKLVKGLRGNIYNTRSFYAGSENPDTNLNNTANDPLFQMFPLKTGVNQVTYDQPPPLLSSQEYLITTARWSKRGSLFLRNIDPVPWTILAVSPLAEIAEQTPYVRV